MSAATMIRPVPGSVPRVLPWKPYVYRGTGEDELTAFMDEPGSRFEDLPRAGRDLKPHGTGAAIRRHQRHGTALCESCRQYMNRHLAERAAADVASGKVVRAVHADAGDGQPRCGVTVAIGDPVMATPGQTVSCKRCTAARGKG